MRADWFDPIDFKAPMLRLTPLTAGDPGAHPRALGSPEDAAEVATHTPFMRPTSEGEAAAIIAVAHGDTRRLAYAQRLGDTHESVGTTSSYDIGHTWVAVRERLTQPSGAR